jgi:hypothetical protein
MKSTKLMTLEEVAMHFNRHKDTIEHWTKKGCLIKYAVGRVVYYKRKEVESAVIPIKRTDKK